MNYKEAVARLTEFCGESSYYRSIGATLAWDQWNGLPNGGKPYRNKLLSFVAGLSSQHIHSDTAKELYEYFSKINDSEHEDIYKRGMAREFLNYYNESCGISVEMTKKMAAVTAESEQAWLKALAAKDYDIFKPYLKEMIEMQIELAGAIDPTRPVFDVLVERTDRGLRVAEIDREFDKLKIAIKELLEKIRKSRVKPDDDILYAENDKDKLMDFVKYLTAAIGYDHEKGAVGETQHPFCDTCGPKDARILLNFQSFKAVVFACLHEAGHAMYGYGGNSEANAHHLWGGISGGFHEGQSRFYENIVGKSYGFWKHFYPETQKRFPRFADLPFEDYYRAVNRVRPSLKRIEADEVTYSLHPIIRFELEKEMLAGNLGVDELPEAWNAKYEHYLGIRPENDGEGILQDVHWSQGLYGYFQSYALGNIYDGQIRKALLKNVPDALDKMSQGDFKPLNAWVAKNIHSVGRAYTAGELMQNVCGEGLNADAFIEYLNEKFTAIYS